MLFRRDLSVGCHLMIANDKYDKTMGRPPSTVLDELPQKE
jgi:hypothetical protein